MSGCWQLWILNWLQRDNWWCNESLLVNALVVSRLHERCLVCRHSHISYQVVVKLKSAMVKKKLHYPSEKVGVFWNLLVTAVRRHFYFEGEHSVLFWVTFLQVSLQFSHCQQPKQLQDGLCRKTLTASGPRPFSKRLLGVAGSVVKTFIVPYRNFFISALARTTCMENITNRLPFYLQFANLSVNKNNKWRRQCARKQNSHMEVFGTAPSLQQITSCHSQKKLQQPLTTWLGNIHFSLVTTSCQTVYRPVWLRLE